MEVNHQLSAQAFNIPVSLREFLHALCLADPARSTEMDLFTGHARQSSATEREKENRNEDLLFMV